MTSSSPAESSRRTGQPLQTGSARLSKTYFLRQRREFQQVKDHGTTYAGRTLVLAVMPAPDGQTRLGLIVSRRYDRHAVGRNRARRLMREAYRLLRSGIREPVWLVSIARQRLHGCKLHEVQQDLLQQLSRAGVAVDLPDRPSGEQ